MTPPEAPVAGDIAKAADQPPAVSVCPQTMRKRAGFLAAAKARRHAMPGFVLQGRERGKDENEESGAIRLGITCSKKVGNAVARNRAKRRLREIARLVLPLAGRTGWDYVLIGRSEVTASRDFEAMQDDLRKALSRIHQARS